MTLEFELTMNQPSNAKIERGLRSKLNLLEDSDFGIVNKKEINSIMADVKTNKKRAKKPVQKLEPKDILCEFIEYKMGKDLADTILKADRTKRNPQEILCEYVNTQYDLKGYCVRVFVN